MGESLTQLQNIHIDDLQYVEKDLCLYQLISLGLLLFGGDRSSAEFILQKLLVVVNNAQQMHNGQSIGITVSVHPTDLLQKYATINPDNWRVCLVEALSIIGARRVLRKLGFNWNELQQYYLPHITELSLNLNPLLKVLYRICERLTVAQADHLRLDINDEHRSDSTHHLRFYDPKFLEIFLLDWLTRRIISVGVWNGTVLKKANVQVLIDKFKLNEMDAFKMLLLSTISCNSERESTADVFPSSKSMINSENSDFDSQSSDKSETTSTHNVTCSLDPLNYATETLNLPLNSASLVSNSSARSYALESDECYTVRRETAGLVVIFNQCHFYEDTDENLKDLLPPRKLLERRGTDVDKQRLIDVFTARGYKKAEYDNKTHIDLCAGIADAVKRSDLFDSLIICILSHGIEGAVYGSNSIPVYISEIEKIMQAETLRSKPKMLIIQACRKDEGPKNAMPQSGSNANLTKDVPDDYTDLIIAMSTMPGSTSIRNTVKGTWYIQALCNAVDTLGDRKHMLDILIAVTRDVVAQRGNRNEFMVPVTSQTLTKYFFLPSRDT